MSSFYHAASDALWEFAALANQQPLVWKLAIYVVALVFVAVALGALSVLIGELFNQAPPARQLPPQWTLHHGRVEDERARSIFEAVALGPRWSRGERIGNVEPVTAAEDQVEVI